MKKRFKVAVSSLLIVSLLLLPACGFLGDPMLDDMWTRNIYPGEASTYDIGSEDYPFRNVTTDNITTDNITTDYLQVSENSTFSGEIILNGDGEVWLEFRLNLDWSTVQAHGKPNHVTRGLFDGFSLPIYAADNEELFLEMCIPDRWKGPAWEKLGDVGDAPGGMAVNDEILYIPCEGDDNVWIYDGSTLSISGNVGDEPHYAYAYDGDIYVSCSGDDTIWVYSGGVWSKSGDVGGSPEGMAEYDGDLYTACRLDDEIWAFDGTTWAVDSALGAGGVAGAVGDAPRYLAEYGGDLYVGCAGTDDDVWIRSGGTWAKDDDVDDDPAEFQEHGTDLYLNCESDDTVWFRSGGVWAVVTNVQATIGNAPVGLEEYGGSLYSACQHSIWSDTHTPDSYAVPFWNANSDFSIPAEDDEPKFLLEYDERLYTSCYASDSIWVYEGQTAVVSIHMWISSAQTVATDAFRLEIAHEVFTPDDDVVSAVSEDQISEVCTGIAAQYQSYGLHMPIDLAGVEGDDSLGIRLRRIASSDEIAGEVVIQHAGVTFKCDKIGSAEP